MLPSLMVLLYLDLDTDPLMDEMLLALIPLLWSILNFELVQMLLGRCIIIEKNTIRWVL